MLAEPPTTAKRRPSNRSTLLVIYYIYTGGLYCPAFVCRRLAAALPYIYKGEKASTNYTLILLAMSTVRAYRAKLYRYRYDDG